MPQYTYECEEHGRFDTLKSMADVSKPTHCPECGRPAELVISAPNVPPSGTYSYGGK